MEVFDAIHRRASVRSFTAEPISEENIGKLCAAALRAPTAGNLLHYSIVTVTDAAVKERLCDLTGGQPFVRTAPLVMVVNVDENRNKKWIERWGGHFHFDGPYLFGIAASDALLAAQNVVLAAEAMGIGSVFVGNVLADAQGVRETLGYPELVLPIALLCLGYPTVKPEPRPRLGVRAVHHRERYQDFGPDEMEALYGDMEGAWAQANPSGRVGRNGVQAYSRSGWTTLAHYTRRAIRSGDQGMRDALRSAGFRGFETPIPERDAEDHA